MPGRQTLKQRLDNRLDPLITSEIEKEGTRILPLEKDPHSVRLEELRAEAEILGLAFKHAQSEFEELVVKPRREHNSKALINLLPDEMLAEIFQNGMTWQNGMTSRPEHHLSVIAGVCDIWRQVAVQTPALWSRINYTLWEDSETLPPLARIQLYLARSKNVQIELNVKLYRGVTNGVIEFYDVIAPHLPRCSLIDITISSFDCAELLFPLPGRLLALRQLSITLTGENEPQEDAEDSDGEYYPAPKIQITSHRDYDVPSFALKVTPGYQVALLIQRSTIKHLEIELSAVDSLQLIAGCPVIETLAVGFMANFENPLSEDLDQVNVPSLTSIHIHGPSIGLRSMLHAISAPNLRHLSLAPYEDGGNGLDHILSTEEPSRFPRLATLSIAHHLPTPKILCRFVSAHSHLVALDVKCAPGVDQVLHSIMPAVPFSTSDAGPPQIRLIRLSCGFGVGAEVNAIGPALRALLERCENVHIEWSSYNHTFPAPIKNVRASFPTRLVPPPLPSSSTPILCKKALNRFNISTLPPSAEPDLSLVLGLGMIGRTMQFLSS